MCVLSNVNFWGRGRLAQGPRLISEVSIFAHGRVQTADSNMRTWLTERKGKGQRLPAPPEPSRQRPGAPEASAPVAAADPGPRPCRNAASGIGRSAAGCNKDLATRKKRIYMYIYIYMYTYINMSANLFRDLLFASFVFRFVFVSPKGVCQHLVQIAKKTRDQSKARPGKKIITIQAAHEALRNHMCGVSWNLHPSQHEDPAAQCCPLALPRPSALHRSAEPTPDTSLGDALGRLAPSNRS